jgi:hypothetical protein
MDANKYYLLMLFDVTLIVAIVWVTKNDYQRHFTNWKPHG